MSAGERAADLTRQMLAFAGKGQFVIEPVDLSKAIQEIAELLAASAAEAGATEHAAGATTCRPWRPICGRSSSSSSTW